VRVYEVVCKNNQSEACCRLDACLDPVLDHPSITNVEINVVEVVVVQLLPVLRPPLCPSSSHKLFNSL
jgi:hypothetical protein